MGMLEKKSAKTQRKSLLKHTPGGVQVENQVDRETIIQDVKKAAAPKKPIVEKTTSICISVSTRNALNSLVTLGEADTVNDLVEQLVTQKIESLRLDQQRNYDIINDVVSKRDKVREETKMADLDKFCEDLVAQLKGSEKTGTLIDITGLTAHDNDNKSAKVLSGNIFHTDPYAPYRTEGEIGNLRDYVSATIKADFQDQWTKHFHGTREIRIIRNEATPYLFILIGADQKLIVVGRAAADLKSNSFEYGDLVRRYDAFPSKSVTAIVAHLAAQRDNNDSILANFFNDLQGEVNRYVRCAIIIPVLAESWPAVGALETALNTRINKKYELLNANSGSR